AVGSFGRSAFWDCHLAQSGSGIASFTLCACIALARDCLDDLCARPGAVKRSVRLPEGSNLGVVRPIRAAFPAQRPFWWVIEETVLPNPHQRDFHYYPIMIVCVIAVSFLFVRNWK